MSPSVYRVQLIQSIEGLDPHIPPTQRTSANPECCFSGGFLMFSADCIVRPLSYLWYSTSRVFIQIPRSYTSEYLYRNRIYIGHYYIHLPLAKILQLLSLPRIFIYPPRIVFIVKDYWNLVNIHSIENAHKVGHVTVRGQYHTAVCRDIRLRTMLQ